MKSATVVMGALVSLFALSPVSADPHVGGTLTRRSQLDGTKSSGCQTASMKRGNNEYVYVEATTTLDAYGARLTVAPTGSCSRRQYTHYTHLYTICFDGYSQDDTNEDGSTITSANIEHDCTGHFGGNGANWSLDIYSGS
jgi:hypothetical protein